MTLRKNVNEFRVVCVIKTQSSKPYISMAVSRGVGGGGVRGTGTPPRTVSHGNAARAQKNHNFGLSPAPARHTRPPSRRRYFGGLGVVVSIQCIAKIECTEENKIKRGGKRKKERKKPPAPVCND